MGQGGGLVEGSQDVDEVLPVNSSNLAIFAQPQLPLSTYFKNFEYVEDLGKWLYRNDVDEATIAVKAYWTKEAFSYTACTASISQMMLHNFDRVVSDQHIHALVSVGDKAAHVSHSIQNLANLDHQKLVVFRTDGSWEGGCMDSQVAEVSWLKCPKGTS